MSRAERRRADREVRKEREQRGRMRGWTAWEFTETVRMPDGTAVPVTASGFDWVAVNGMFTVMARKLAPDRSGMPEGVHLSIRRNDRDAIHDWRHLQRIKNELLGAEWEGVELYPAESRKVDAANQFHLWCWPFRLPFGFQERDVSDDVERAAAVGARQRPGALEG